MPELPEVETVRRELSEKILNKTIQNVEIRYEGSVRNEASEFKHYLEGKSFQRIDRIGKLMQFSLSDESGIMLAHLKMTGQFLYQQDGKTAAGIYPLLYASTPGGKRAVGSFKEKHQQEGLQINHTHVVFSFEDQSQLAYRDQRKFGYLELVENSEIETIESRYGIDPLREHFTLENFREQFRGRKKSLKAVLMDQSLIAGIGNIYADEICHQVGIRPQRSVRKISKKKVEEVYFATGDIISAAVKNKGTSFRDFKRSNGEQGSFVKELQVYGRSGGQCHKCKTNQVKKIQYLGRGTHYCPECQK